MIHIRAESASMIGHDDPRECINDRAVMIERIRDQVILARLVSRPDAKARKGDTVEGSDTILSLELRRPRSGWPRRSSMS